MRSTGRAGSPVRTPSRFVRPDLAVARLEAPLQRANETIGLLLVGSRRERGFEVDELETLSSLANQAAIAIENARLQARLRELAVVAERERIAREMHDGLAQVLGYVNTKSQAIEELLVAGRTDAAREQLAELGRRGSLDLHRRPRSHPRAAEPGHPRPRPRGRSGGLCGALRRGVEDRGPRRRPALRPPARGRARRGSAGLPDRPGGADERPQARRRASCRGRFDVRDGGLEVVIRDDGHGGTRRRLRPTIGPATGCARCANAPRASAPRWTG